MCAVVCCNKRSDAVCELSGAEQLSAVACAGKAAASMAIAATVKPALAVAMTGGGGDAAVAAAAGAAAGDEVADEAGVAATAIAPNAELVQPGAVRCCVHQEHMGLMVRQVRFVESRYRWLDRLPGSNL